MTSRTPYPLARTIATIAGTVLLIVLAGLQVGEALRAGAAADALARLRDATPVALSSGMDLDAGEARGPVIAHGTFPEGMRLFLIGRTRGEAVGAHVVRPLRLADDTVLFVDRGWVPSAWRAEPPSAREENAAVVGVLRPVQPRRLFMPANDPAGGRWFRVDPAAMAAALGLDPDRVRPYWLQAAPTAAAEQEERASYPQGSWPQPGPALRHWLFAAGWLAIAFGLVLVHVAAVRRSVRKGGRP